MQRLLPFILLVTLSSLSTQASSSDITTIETAFALNHIESLVDMQPISTTTYTSLFLDYRLAAALIQNGEKSRAKTIINRALKKSKSLEPDTELYALQAALYGLKIILQPLSVVTLNKKANNALQNALELSPNNPRALLMQGVAKFQTPGLFGGSKKQALALLQRGLNARQKEAGILWGSVDLHLWLGRVLADTGRPEQAMYHYQQALSLSPNNYWVQQAISGDGFTIE